MWHEDKENVSEVAPFLVPLRPSNRFLPCSKYRLKGAVKVALHCAHRATTASSWGLCEQKGHLTAPVQPFSTAFFMTVRREIA